MATVTVNLTTTPTLLGIVPDGGSIAIQVPIAQTTGCIVSDGPGAYNPAVAPFSTGSGIALEAGTASTPGGDYEVQYGPDKPGGAWWGWVTSGTGSVDVEILG